MIRWGGIGMAAALCLVLVAPVAARQASTPQVAHVAVEVREASGLITQLSPDGRRLAFLMLGSVFVGDRATGRALPVIDPDVVPTLYSALAWAPDSRRLALLTSDRPGTLEGLVVVDVATGNRTTVSSLADFTDVAWAGDGALLAARAGGDSVEIRRYPETAGGTPTIPIRLPRGAGRVTLSPDGRSLAYTTSLSGAARLPTPRSEIVEADLATGARRTITPAGTLDAFPAYSPDGHSIAFLSSRGGTPQVWVAARDGAAPRPLTDGVEDVLLTPLSWTPDSRAVVYAARGRAWLAPLEGGASTELPFAATVRAARWSGLGRPELPVPGTTRTARGLSDPALAPDGRSLVFSALGDLWIAAATGGVARRLTDTPARDEVGAIWAPDSRRLIYVALDVGRMPAVILRDVTREDPGAALPLPGLPAAWSPDGRLIAFAELPGGSGPPRSGWMDLASGEVHRFAPIPGMLEATTFSAASDSLLFIVAADAVPDSIHGGGGHRRFLRAALRDSAASAPWEPTSVPGGMLAASSPGIGRVAWSDTGVGYWVEPGAKLPPTPLADYSPRSFSWSADGTRLLYLSQGRLRLLDVPSGQARTVDVAPTYTVADVPPDVVIRNARIVDGRGSPATDPVDVLVEAGRIARIGPALPTSQGIHEVDGTGRTLIPGLFDLHVHLFGGEAPSPLFLHYGVTTVRDLGTRGEAVRGQRERSETGTLPMPRIVMSAGQLTAGYGIGLRGDGLYREEAASTPAAANAAASSLRGNGADLIKVYFQNNTFEGLAIDAAHVAGLPVTSHYLSLGAFARGLEGKEHANFYFLGDAWTTTWREDALALTKAAGTCVTPTLVTYLGLTRGRSPIMPFDSAVLKDEAIGRYTSPFSQWLLRQIMLAPLPPASQSLWNQRFATSVGNVRRMRAAGVRVAAGTDAGPLGWSLHAELELLVMAGYTPLEAIRAATLDAAACAGLDASLGSIETGKIADLVLVDGDPASRIQDARRVHMVFLGGRPLTRDDIAMAWTGAPLAR